MIYWQMFLAFFIPGILGYGGGPSAIPLIENEVVGNYGWMTSQEFSEIVAVGNSLPGPIATKMAAYIGYSEAGIIGSIVALFATIAPSIIMMLLLMAVLLKYKDTTQMKNISSYVRPVIAILLAEMTFQFLGESMGSLGVFYTILLIVGSYILMEKLKWHPAIVIFISLCIGAITGIYQFGVH